MFETTDLFRNYQQGIPKIFESIITKKLSQLMSQQLVDNQHGFRQKKSTLTNLILYQTKIISAFEHGQQVDSIYTDFQKAFDKVNHRLLTAKLEHFGFNGSFLNWIKSYLINRS